MSDFDRLAARLGPARLRLTELPETGAGRAWRADVAFHGTRRRGLVRVADMRPPESYVVLGEVEGVSARLAVAVCGAGPARSRLTVTVDAAPSGIAGRVFLGPLSLVRRGLEARLAARLAGLAREIEGAAR